MQGKYILMPDENVGVVQLARLYRLRSGEWLDGSRLETYRGRRNAGDVPLYPIYSPNDDGREEIPLYNQWADHIASLRGTEQLWNPGGDTIPEELLNGMPYNMYTGHRR